MYLFAMLIPLYGLDLGGARDIAAVLVAFAFIVFIFWHMNLHYMNVAFAVLGYRVYTIVMESPAGSPKGSVVLLSKRHVRPPAGTSIDGLRISDTVFMERTAANA